MQHSVSDRVYQRIDDDGDDARWEMMLFFGCYYVSYCWEDDCYVDVVVGVVADGGWDSFPMLGWGMSLLS